MTNHPIISLDAMGGDDAPEIVIQGAELALRQYPRMKLVLVGDEQRLKKALGQTTFARSIDIIHADDMVMPEDKPSGIAEWQKYVHVAGHQAGGR